ncbi:MAG: beta-galactosidase GalB [Pseudomonadota bacterium]
MKKPNVNLSVFCLFLLALVGCGPNGQSLKRAADSNLHESASSLRERILLDSGWQFFKYEKMEQADKLIYDIRPPVATTDDGKDADAMPTQAADLTAAEGILKPWVLPTANHFIKDPSKHHVRPSGNPGSDFPFVQASFDDSKWASVNLPHDWAIAGPFYQGANAEVGGGMGRLPSHGVAWYRRSLDISASDAGKLILLDVDGAMSYAMVWINGKLAGGWPYGYTSWRVDLTPHIVPGGINQLAIRIDNPNHSSRWYPGGGLYRNVWLTKTAQVQIAQSGTYITTPQVSTTSATINLSVQVNNQSNTAAIIHALTEIYALGTEGKATRKSVATMSMDAVVLAAGKNVLLHSSALISNPELWGPPPTQKPSRYLAVTTLFSDGKAIDSYNTPFGIRELRFDANKGVFINGERIYIQGANQHHDLGALGAAFNVRAAERQLELLRDMGVNSIRLAHNPPAKELLELTDRMGFLVINEIFDSWERKKTPHDFHLIFPDWHEPDLRAFIRRDRNNPSVIMWSIGNEVGEQYTDKNGAAIAKILHGIAKEEDPTRPTATAMNYAKPDMPLPEVMDTISLNYQGEGIRNAPAYAHLKGIRTAPLYPAFHEKFPNKLILSSENAAAVSSRGEYFFPVTEDVSAPVSDGVGADPVSAQVSAYELYTAPFGSSADKVLGSLEQHPYVAGGFVWSGWDYIGEPTPYYSARSSYYGAIDLAGFKKNRFYLYQAQWRPDLPMAHILPHWNWPDRIGKVTPVHVFTSGDEAELFLNGQSLGGKRKAPFEYRLRWDQVVYQPGELKVIAYKNGAKWAENSVQTTSETSAIRMEADRNVIAADGKDLAFITLSVVDKNGHVVPTAKNQLDFKLEGPGEIVATDNGDPTNLVSFKSQQRDAFNGLCLVIVRATPGTAGSIKVIASAHGLIAGVVELQAKK